MYCFMIILNANKLSYLIKRSEWSPAKVLKITLPVTQARRWAIIRIRVDHVSNCVLANDRKAASF